MLGGTVANFSPNQNLPAANGPNRPASGGKGCLGGCLGLIAVFVLVVAGCTALSSGNSPSSGNDSYEAKAACEERISSQLKAPATAEFDSTVTGGGGQYTVTGTVDSENSFGAMLRSNYECSVRVDEAKTYTTVDSFG
jgi:hypothetical protein